MLNSEMSTVRERRRRNHSDRRYTIRQKKYRWGHFEINSHWVWMLWAANSSGFFFVVKGSKFTDWLINTAFYRNKNVNAFIKASKPALLMRYSIDNWLPWIYFHALYWQDDLFDSLRNYFIWFTSSIRQNESITTGIIIQKLIARSIVDRHVWCLPSSRIGKISVII